VQFIPSSSTDCRSLPASEVHARIDAGGLGGKIVLLPWPASATNHTTAIMK